MTAGGARRIRVAELDFLYGAMLDCLGPEPDLAPDPGAAECTPDGAAAGTESYSPFRATLQIVLAPYVQHPTLQGELS
ncbi:hypothetical protein [Streptomyces sp. FIT100]|uniref:hypothetical protein n=1 Tax=Streptomyces sp. FIT100 TaxID=2837956 RepID=UPI0021C8D66A|nr:hypothetical protein [Streptomyces sp. FIT100]UUN27432.1 hypothetical protein KK483_14240 [Streptomyces sp. FIT100]